MTIILINVLLSQGYETLFTPDVLKADTYKNYLNYPVLAPNNYNIEITRTEAPDTILHQSYPTGKDAIIGVAMFKNFLNGFKRFVGSLRYFGYDGHIILGVHSSLSNAEYVYLKQMNVTLYGITISNCDSIANSESVPGIIRGKCTKDIPHMKLEWSRFEMARRWLLHCASCTGWVLVMDTRDAFFQQHPVSTSNTLE